MSKLVIAVLCGLALLASSQCLKAATPTLLYWDINGATANSGGSAPSGIWDTTTPNWTTSSGGTLATIAWTDIAEGNNPRFSAGTDATGTYTITIPDGDTRNVSQLYLNNGGANVTISGGTISLKTAVSTTVANFNFQQAGTVAATLRIDSQLSGSVGIKAARSTADLNILILSNPNNNFTGDAITRNNNTMRWAANNVIPDTAILSAEVVGGNYNPTFDLAGYSDTVKSITHSGDAGSSTRGPNSKILLGSGTLTVANPAGEIFRGVISGTGGSFVKQGSGSLTLMGANTYSGNTTVENGTLILQNADPLHNSANIVLGTASTAGTLDVTGVTGGLNVRAAQTLKGNGNITGSATINGTASPGFSVGSEIFSGGLTLAGDVQMELDRSLAQNADKIAAPTIALGGSLHISNIGAALEAGDAFDLFDGTLSAAFANIYTPDVSGLGLIWDTSGLNAGGSGVISLSAVPEPSSLALSLLGGLGLMWMIRRRTA